MRRKEVDDLAAFQRDKTREVPWVRFGQNGAVVGVPRSVAHVRPHEARDFQQVSDEPVRGFFGVHAYLHYPELITKNLGNDSFESLLMKIAELDRTGAILPPLAGPRRPIRNIWSRATWGL